eukprot:2166136-Rhodomonas_salina.3
MHTRQCAPRGCCRRSTAPDTAIVAQSVPDIAVLKAMVWQYGSAIVASVAQPLVLRHCIPVAYVSAGHRTLVPHCSGLRRGLVPACARAQAPGSTIYMSVPDMA